MQVSQGLLLALCRLQITPKKLARKAKYFANIQVGGLMWEQMKCHRFGKVSSLEKVLLRQLSQSLSFLNREMNQVDPIRMTFFNHDEIYSVIIIQ